MLQVLIRASTIYTPITGSSLYGDAVHESITLSTPMLIYCRLHGSINYNLIRPIDYVDLARGRVQPPRAPGLDSMVTILDGPSLARVLQR